MEANHHARAGIRRDALTIERSRLFGWLVRAGFLARGLTYGVLGGVSVALALGAGSKDDKANQEGALTLIARAPLGRIVIGVVAIGLISYAVWKLARGILGTGPEGGGGTDLLTRTSDLGGGLVYLGFFAVAVRVLIGAGGNQSAEQRQAAAGVLGWPGGQELVGLAGFVLIAISIQQLYGALRGQFTRDNKLREMNTERRRLFLGLGRAGLTARSIVFALVGYFLVKTAIDFRAKHLGIDGALAEVHGEPFGNVLLGLVAAGLLVFAFFSFFEARYQRL